MDSKEKEIMFNHLINDSDLTQLYISFLKEVKKDLEILEILKPYLKQSLKIKKIDLTKEENRIYKGYLPKDYNKDYIYTWCYCYGTWGVFKNEENAIKLKAWLDA